MRQWKIYGTTKTLSLPEISLNVLQLILINFLNVFVRPCAQQNINFPQNINGTEKGKMWQLSSCNGMRSGLLTNFNSQAVASLYFFLFRRVNVVILLISETMSRDEFGITSVTEIIKPKRRSSLYLCHQHSHRILCNTLFKHGYLYSLIITDKYLLNTNESS